MLYRQGYVGGKQLSRAAAIIPRKVLVVSQMTFPKSFCLQGRRRVRKSSQVAETTHLQSAICLQAEHALRLWRWQTLLQPHNVLAEIPFTSKKVRIGHVFIFCSMQIDSKANQDSLKSSGVFRHCVSVLYCSQESLVMWCISFPL